MIPVAGSRRPCSNCNTFSLESTGAETDDDVRLCSPLLTGTSLVLLVNAGPSIGTFKDPSLPLISTQNIEYSIFKK